MAVTVLDRRPATWAEYDALGDDLRAEYIDGCIVTPGLPSRRHQQASARFWQVLDAALPPGYEVVLAWGWKPADDEFGPDVMVVPVTQEDVRFTGTPALCIEVTSSNRANDYVTKIMKYAEAGLDHYWILDLEVGVLDVLVREGVHYRLDQQLTRDQVGRLDFGVARVRVDLNDILSERVS